MSDVPEYLPLVLQVAPTDRVVSVGGVPCRVWGGVDPQERQYVLLVRQVLTDDPDAQKLLESMLVETPPPRLEQMEGK